MKNFKGKGFTLIELLVTIAIIGILSSITMVMLNSARARARDASVMQNLGQIRTQAGLYASDYEDFGVTSSCIAASSDVFFGTDNVVAIMESVGSEAVCASYGDKYVVTAPLATSEGESWCVDYKNGARKVITPGSALELVWAGFDCDNVGLSGP